MESKTVNILEQGANIIETTTRTINLKDAAAIWAATDFKIKLLEKQLVELKDLRSKYEKYKIEDYITKHTQ